MATPAFDLGRRSDSCAATGTPLKPGDAVVTALFERPGEEALDRRDYLETAWSTLARPEGLFAFWRGIVPDPGAPRSQLIDGASMMSIFEQLEGATEPRRIAFRYMLALVLVRRRLLVLVGSTPARGDDPALLLVRPKGSPPEEPPIEVIDPAMDEATIADAAEQLQSILKADA